MLIHVSPRFILNTCKLSVTELVSPRGDEKCIHSFDDSSLPIAIFRDRMTGWFFDPAIKLLHEGQDVAAVHIVTPLIEALEERCTGKPGKSNSAAFFKRRAQEIFGLNDNALDLLYAGLRCGFSHHGFLKDDEKKYNILLTYGLQDAVEYRDFVLYIDSPKYVEKVRDAYEKYYNRLESDSGLLDHFIRIWNEDWQMSLRVPGGAGTVPNNV